MFNQHLPNFRRLCRKIAIKIFATILIMLSITIAESVLFKLDSHYTELKLKCDPYIVFYNVRLWYTYNLNPPYLQEQTTSWGQYYVKQIANVKCIVRVTIDSIRFNPNSCLELMVRTQASIRNAVI